jgi:hypothetical protein
MNSKLIGISGLARSGKDTVYEMCRDALAPLGKTAKRLAFADELKKESDEFLLKNIGISAFTEKTHEKEIIRPFLVTYGTHLRRKLNKRCWIDKVEEQLRARKENFIFITDVRYNNEISWVHSLGGTSIHVEREGNLAPNKEEETNDPILKDKSEINIKWKDLDIEDQSIINSIVLKILTKINNG